MVKNEANTINQPKITRSYQRAEERKKEKENNLQKTAENCCSTLYIYISNGTAERKVSGNKFTPTTMIRVFIVLFKSLTSNEKLYDAPPNETHIKTIYRRESEIFCARTKKGFNEIFCVNFSFDTMNDKRK